MKSTLSLFLAIIILISVQSTNGFTQSSEDSKYVIFLHDGDTISTSTIKRIDSEYLLVRQSETENLYNTLSEIKTVVFIKNGSAFLIYPEPKIPQDSTKSFAQQLAERTEADDFNFKEMSTQIAIGYAYSGLLMLGSVGTTLTILSNSGKAGDGPGPIILVWFLYTALSFTTPYVVFQTGENLTDKNKYETSLGKTYLWGSFATILTLGTTTPIASAIGYQLNKQKKYQEKSGTE